MLSSSNPAPCPFSSPGTSFKSEQTQGEIELPKVRGAVKSEDRASEFTSRECLLPPARHTGCPCACLRPRASQHAFPLARDHGAMYSPQGCILSIQAALFTELYVY